MGTGVEADRDAWGTSRSASRRSQLVIRFTIWLAKSSRSWLNTAIHRQGLANAITLSAEGTSMDRKPGKGKNGSFATPERRAALACLRRTVRPVLVDPSLRV